MSKFTEDDYARCFVENYEKGGDLELGNLTEKLVSLNHDNGAFVLCWKWIDDTEVEAMKNNDHKIILEIQELMSAVEWTPQTLDNIAEVLNDNGYRIEDVK